MKAHIRRYCGGAARGIIRLRDQYPIIPEMTWPNQMGFAAWENDWVTHGRLRPRTSFRFCFPRISNKSFRSCNRL